MTKHWFTLVVLLAATTFAADAPPPQITGATINGEKVPPEFVRRYYDRLTLIYKNANRPIDAALADKLAQLARQQAVQNTAVRQHVEKNKIAVTEKAIDEQLETARDQIANTGLNVELLLKSRNETMDDLRREVVPVAALMQSIRGTLDVEKLKPAFEKDKERIQRRKVSHILFMHQKAQRSSQPERAPEEARKLADAALRRIREGEDLAAIARADSDCPSKAQGGDLGWFLPKQMVKPFSDAAYALEKVGDVSPVIETEFGYHIIKLTGLRTDEDVWNYYVRQSCEKELAKTVQGIVREAKVE